MGATITRSKAPPKPKVNGGSSYSLATRTNTDSSAQAGRPSDLKNIVTNTEESPKKEIAAEPTLSQNAKAITSPDQADIPGNDLKNIVSNTEESPQKEVALEPNQSQNTEAITSPDQADRPDDINEKGRQSQTTQDGTEADNMSDQDNESDRESKLSKCSSKGSNHSSLSTLKSLHIDQSSISSGSTRGDILEVLEEIRAKMESYKQLYDAGDTLPGGSDYDLCPGYWLYNTEYQVKAEVWMLEYKVPELFKRTLDEMTPIIVRNDESVFTTCQTMLSILFNMTDFSKIIADMGAIVSCDDVMCEDMFSSDEEDSDSKPARHKQPRMTPKQKLEVLRAKMESYKILYDAGHPLPRGTADDFYPDYVKTNSKYKVQIVDWMVEYSVPEIYLKTLENTTYTTWLGERSTWISAYTALGNLRWLTQYSKRLVERLLALGYLNYLLKNLKDQRYLNNHNDNQVIVNNVMVRMIGIVRYIVELVPDHVTYKQLDLTQALKKYISSDFKFATLTIILTVASEDVCTALVNTELDIIRARMESYKQLYDAGDSLPGGTDSDLRPYYLKNNLTYQDKAVPWLLENKVPELFKRTLDKMTSTDIRCDESVYTTFINMMHDLNAVAYYSKIFAEKIIDLNYIQRFVQILSDPQFRENQHKERTQKVLDMVLGGIRHCVRHIPGHWIYKETQLTKVLKPYLASDNMLLRAKAMMAYSRVIDESEIKQLNDSGCINFMITGINSALQRADRCFIVENTHFDVVRLLECVTRLAANDANKKKLVDAGLLPILVKSLQTGPEEELEISAKLIWTLCFDEDTKKKVVNQKGLIRELERLSTGSFQGVQKAAKGALWKISGEENHQQQSQQKTYENKHIFISYQWDDQQMILELNRRLKEDGYNTWIDVEQMGGSTLDAMAAAVENAALVLICASEKYKLSPNCHTEGAYTYQTGKPVIPLMMQRRYKPDGWLGMLMGVKLYINFDGKYEFNKAYQMLMKEMTPILNVSTKPDGDAKDVVAAVPHESSVVPSASQTSQPAAFVDLSVATWKNKQVMEWATKHNLTKCSSEFDSMLKSMDGTQLVNFCEMKTEASDVFYKLMTEEYKLNMKAIISLKIAMKELE